MKNNFETCLKIGKMVEAFVKSYFENSFGFIVEDKSNIKEGQDKDIDFIVHNEDNSIGFTLEVKSDARIHNTGNFLIEYGHHRKTGFCNGGYFKCKADCICFYDRIDRHGYVLNGRKMREDIATKEWDKEQVFRFDTFNNKKEGCDTDAYFIKVNKARERGYVICEF